MKLSKIALGVSLAIAASSASATSVPGVPSDLFEYSKPGIDADASITSGPGLDAINNINAILDSVQATGGSDIDNDAFWKAFVKKTETKVFEYGLAAPMIEELIFTVTGEIHSTTGAVDANGYRKAVDFSSLGGSNEISDMTSKISYVSNGGNYIDGKLSETKANAVSLLSLLGFDVTDPDAIVDATTSDTVKGDVLSGAVDTATTAASIDSQGFKNANNLIALIAQQLKVGFILDVDKASAGLQAIADQHYGYLSASLVDEAKAVKSMIRFIGVQESAVAIGKGARGVCDSSVVSTNSNEAEACVRVGKEFQDLVSKLPVDNQEAINNYEDALAAVDQFVSKIIGFNAGMVSSADSSVAYDAVTEAAAISGQFGTITVVADELTPDSLYNQLNDGNPLTGPQSGDITSGEVASDLDTGFDSTLDIDGIEGIFEVH